MYSPEQVAQATGAPLANCQKQWPLVLDALTWAGINDHATRVAAIGTISAETGIFWPIEEEGGWDYYVSILGAAEAQWHGRGLIQLTWSYNYRHYGGLIGVDLVDNPALAMDNAISAKVLALYFRERGIPGQANAGDWIGVRRSVNGGSNGLSQQMAAINAILSVPETPTPQPAQITTLTVNASLKPDATHTSTAVADLAAGCVVTFTNDPKTKQVVSKDGLWAYCRVASGTTQKKRNAAGLVGYLLRASLQTR